MNDRERGTHVDDVTTAPTTRAVAEVLAHVLGGPLDRFGPDTELFGRLPELDSLALVELITASEDRFGFEFDEEDITFAVFATVQSLASHIDSCTARP